MVGGLQRLTSPTLRQPAAIPAGTERGQHLHRVLHQVFFGLAVIQHHQAAAVCGQGRLE